jgi:hypothetical protein
MNCATASAGILQLGKLIVQACELEEREVERKLVVLNLNSEVERSAANQDL